MTKDKTESIAEVRSLNKLNSLSSEKNQAQNFEF